jgi:WD40 repeat protein
MSGIEWLNKAKQREIEKSTRLPPSNIDEAVERMNEYINTQLPLTFEMDFIPVCFDVTADQEKVFVGGEFGNIGIFNFSTKKMTKDIELTSKAIKTVLLACDDKMGIAVTSANLIYFLEFPSFYMKKTMFLQGGPLVLRLNYLKDSIYIANSTFHVRFIELEKFEEKVLTFEEQVNCLDVSDDGSLIALGGENGTIRLIHGETEIPLQVTEPRESSVEILAFSQFRRFVAAGFSDFIVVVYNIDGEMTVKSLLDDHKGQVTGLAFTNKGRYLITGGADNKIMVLDMTVEGLPFFLELYDQPVLYFKTSPDFTKLFFSQHINRLMIWKIPSLSKNARFRKHEGKVTTVLFIPGGFELLSLGEDGLAVIWDYRNNVESETIELEGKLITGVLSKRSSFAIIANDAPALIRLSLATYKSYVFELNCIVNAIQMNEAEDLMTLSDNYFRILVYDCVTMERKYVIKGHLDMVNCMKFVYFDSTLVTCSDDQTLVKWDIKNSTKISVLCGHQAAVKCLVVTPDEQLVFSGDASSQIYIWNLDYDVLTQIISVDPSPSGILSILLAEDVSYLVILQETRVTFMEFSNFSIIFQKDSELKAASMTLDKGERFLALTEEDTIFVEENPLNCETIKVVGKSYGSSHKFMNFVREIQSQNSRSEYSETFNHWLFTPYRIGLAHILSYANKNTTLAQALFNTSNKSPFCATINDENPLSIAVNMDHGSCVELCLKYMKGELSSGNLRAFMPLANCLTELTKLDLPVIPKIYDLIYQKSEALHLPNFSVEGLTCLPSLFKSENIIINIEILLPPDLRATHGESITFFGSICPFNLEIGTEDSVNFLEGLLECNFPEIFRSKVLVVILRDKWEQVKTTVNIQGSCYILYLIMLSIYCIFLRSSNLFLAALFFVHLLLFFYEVLQIATDFVDYWFDMWNILDQLRGLSFTIYVFLQWQGNYNQNFLLTAIIFSWTRGISYFRMFEGTRYMVRLLSEVINDMQVFFVILFYSTLAFTFIFYINEGKMSFAGYLTLSYRLDLADFVTDEYQGFDWVIFFLATVINPLVMLNLLISIMGTTYERVKEGNDIANYQELTGMIMEIEKLMFWKKKIKKQFFLQQCIPALELEAEESDKKSERLKSMRVKLVNIEADLNEIQMELESQPLEDVDSVLSKCKSGEVLAGIIRNDELLGKSQEILEKILEKVNNV